MTRQAPKKTARWVAVTISHPLLDAPTEAVLSIRHGSPPTRMHLTSGHCPSADALAVVAGLCAVKASYLAVQAGDGSIVEITAIAADRGKVALEAAVVAVELPDVDVRAVLAEGPVTLVA